MVLASCLDLLKSDHLFAPDRSTRRQRRRPPLFLEPLEDRVVPDVSGNVFGGVDNPTVNPALASAGIVLPVFPNGPQNGLILQPFFADSPQDIAMGDRVDFLAQDQRAEQFRVLGVNSQGQGNEFGQSPWIVFSYGFGSGTQPGQPWAPEYQTVGLANRPSLPLAPTVAYGPGQGGGAAAGSRPGAPIGGQGGNQPGANPQGGQGPRDQGQGFERPGKQPFREDDRRNEQRRPPQQQSQQEQSKEPKAEEQVPADQKNEVRRDGLRGEKAPENEARAKETPSADGASWADERGAAEAAVLADSLVLHGQFVPSSLTAEEQAPLLTRLPAPVMPLELAVDFPDIDLTMDWASFGE